MFEEKVLICAECGQGIHIGTAGEQEILCRKGLPELTQRVPRRAEKARKALRKAHQTATVLCMSHMRRCGKPCKVPLSQAEIAGLLSANASRKMQAEQ
jgi:hypothetical protein